MRKLLFIFSFSWLFTTVTAQEVLTLEECLKIGIANNLDLRTKKNDIQKGKHSISENRAHLLPQINAVAAFNDNFNPPVSVTDGSSFGRPYNVTNTLQYNASAGFQLNLPLYNKTIYTAVNLAKMMDQINQLSYEKAREDLMMQISKMYYLAQSTAEQISLVKDNIGRLTELKNITVAFYDNDMAMEVDVKRVNINLENLQVQHDNATAMLEQQLNMLKYVLDYPAEKQISLEPIDTESINAVALSGLSKDLYELQLLNEKTLLLEKQKSAIREGYLPSLYLTGNFMYTAFTDRVYHWFRNNPSNHWYHSSGIGVSLRIPIFDGFDKRSKKRKINLDIDNSKIAYENALKGLQTQYMNATNELQNSQRNFSKQKDNFQLAKDVYTVTSDRYKEGISSMTRPFSHRRRHIR